jgi:hypothetical protein
MARVFEQSTPMVHVRFQGRSWDLPASLLGSVNLRSEHDIKQAVARHLEIPFDQLAPYVVEWHENENVTIRPEAVFG